MLQAITRLFQLSFLGFFVFTLSAAAQISGLPSADCHITDGQFTICADGSSEWSDVQPIAFSASNSFLYVNQDAAHAFLYLMYDFPLRTAPLAATESVHITFDTVEQVSGTPKFIVYDILIFPNGTIQVLQQGQPTPQGNITAAAGFGVSPNSSTPHLTAELQVPLVAGPPSTYSPDPLFWNASLPPTTPTPDPCPTDAGKSFSNCTKKIASVGGTVLTLGGIGAGVVAGLCTAGTFGGCAPAEVPLIIGGGISAAAGYLIDKYIAGDPPGLILTIPPDPNFTTIAQPPVYSVSIPTPGVTTDQAAAFSALYSNLEQLVALEQAGIISVARAEGASAAGSPFWVTQQTQAAQNYAAQAGVLLDQLPGLWASLAAALQAGGSQGTFTANDVQNFLTAINPASPTSELQTEFQAMQSILTQLGFTSDDQAIILQLVLGSDPQSIASLGVGAFPASLTDPVSNQSLQQLGNALISSAPSQTNLNSSFNITLPGDYVAHGVGLRGGSAPSFGTGLTTAPITITGIPAGASVVRAFLYWGMLDNGFETALGQMSINGTPVTGSLVGVGPDTCWGRTNSFTFRAEVTASVTGNGTYTLSGVANGGNILPEGASLVVIYQLAGLPTKTVILSDGNIAIPQGAATGTTSFSGFTTAAPVTATTTFMVGDGQALQFGTTPVIFSGSLGSISLPGLFPGADGPIWDTATFDVSPVVSPGVSSDTATITVSGDCLLWSAQAFSVTSVAPTAPVTATAAVVEASATGDTVANLRGLATADAPTLTDEIAMVVQFRTIQNPAISGADLTQQLVNGLVNDGVIPPAQASTIIQNVENHLVTPTPSGTGDVTPPTIVITTPAATNYVLNQVVAANYTCTDTGSGVATCVGTVPNGSNISTSSVGAQTFTVNASDNAGNRSTQSVKYNVDYGICLLYDPTHAAKSGSTIPIKFQLCDAAGNDVSSATTTVNAAQVVMTSTNASFTVDDAGNANPDSNFRFDSTLGSTGGYIFNLKTTGLTTGTYVLTFNVAGDPVTHNTELVFQVR